MNSGPPQFHCEIRPFLSYCTALNSFNSPEEANTEAKRWTSSGAAKSREEWVRGIPPSTSKESLGSFVRCFHRTWAKNLVPSSAYRNKCPSCQNSWWPLRLLSLNDDLLVSLLDLWSHEPTKNCCGVWLGANHAHGDIRDQVLIEQIRWWWSTQWPL